ncbi:bifunctional 4-hydroxy-2-oxoglutarate aldolase/2-dehydro-3-deoxy-phosphogluconate aldolase [Rhodococcus sp. IEGM 248]|uniref:bifunctional 4-hydroxy-2-oxoglutarate aldolase/2-dehydro-3-deoxy-phosphogluconate aldolase n=1 Tax=Rhodococcus opacus TaxID=37919 RepID=UPI0013BF99C2|nr:bifunctional 4-hydroxy-2-oxoglutarate aldolase/2-dehydro-3-deoxy-phosphogluconate aldolase [Rhodococcus opacus]MDV7085817.1 bifunctional 4-hydroxy-2-oxoglutarate aldolase/2-dehydro-3-deoxy-phosphogluconate aldolase [Rhodococcus opacus]NDV05303.1 bifunctional 4-hydroxy-2-oxoglutarate aldolase/2-dehydro-3-deoxy-phosphogluconate aldolase [Rhodococcus sp. IEGM 248]
MTSSVIAVLRAAHADRYAPVVNVLAENGVRAVELTMSTPGTLESLSSIRRDAPDGVEIGVGTVTTVDQARAALDVGADFLVTPTTNLDVIATAVRAGVPIYPGGFTPTELWTGWHAGASAVKLFPASVVGPEYIGHLRGPFPDIQVVPSGGVGIDDVPAWFAAGAAAVSLGGPLIGDAFRGGDLGQLAERCRRLGDVVAELEVV